MIHACGAFFTQSGWEQATSCISLRRTWNCAENHQMTGVEGNSKALLWHVQLLQHAAFHMHMYGDAQYFSKTDELHRQLV